MAYGIYEIFFKKDKREIKGIYHGYKKVNNLYCRPIFQYSYGTKKYNQASIQEFKVEKIEKDYVKGQEYPYLFRGTGEYILFKEEKHLV